MDVAVAAGGRWPAARRPAGGRMRLGLGWNSRTAGKIALLLSRRVNVIKKITQSPPSLFWLLDLSFSIQIGANKKAGNVQPPSTNVHMDVHVDLHTTSMCGVDKKITLCTTTTLNNSVRDKCMIKTPPCKFGA